MWYLLTPVVQDVHRASSCFSPRHLSDLLFFNPRHSALFFLLLLLLSAFLPLSFLPLPSSSSVRLVTSPLTTTTPLYLAHPVHILISSSPLPIFLPSTDAPPYGRWANGLAGPLRPVGCAVWLSPGALHLAGSTSSHCRHLWVTYSPAEKTCVRGRSQMSHEYVW